MTIQEKVAEKIAGSNETISAAVIDKMANTVGPYSLEDRNRMNW